MSVNCCVNTIISFDIPPLMYEFGLGFSYFGLIRAPGRMCTALVEDLVLTSILKLFFTVIVPFHHILTFFNHNLTRHSANAITFSVGLQS